MTVYDYMSADGSVENVNVKKTSNGLSVNGRKFVTFATFDQLTAHCLAEAKDAHPIDNPLAIRLPPPMGSILYPAPLVWASEAGLANHWNCCERGKLCQTVPLQEDWTMCDASESDSSSDMM